MVQNLTANQIGGRAIGALFFTGFGAIWLLLGLYAKQRLTAAPLSLVACSSCYAAQRPCPACPKIPPWRVRSSGSTSFSGPRSR